MSTEKKRDLPNEHRVSHKLEGHTRFIDGCPTCEAELTEMKRIAAHAKNMSTR